MAQYQNTMQPQVSCECKQVLLKYSCGCQCQNSHQRACMVDCGAQTTHNVEESCPLCVNKENVVPETTRNLIDLDSIKDLITQRSARPVSENSFNPFCHNASATSSFSSSISWATALSRENLLNTTNTNISYSPGYMLQPTTYGPSNTGSPPATYIPRACGTLSPILSENSDDSDGGVALPDLSLLAVEQLSGYTDRKPFDLSGALFYADQLFDNTSERSSANELRKAELPEYWTTESYEEEIEPFPSIPSFTVGQQPLTTKIRVRRPKYEIDRPHRSLYGYNRGLPPANASTSLVRSHSELYNPLPHLQFQSRPQSNIWFTNSSSETGPDDGGSPSHSTFGDTQENILRWTVDLPTSSYETLPSTKKETNKRKRVSVESPPESPLSGSSSPPAPPLTMYRRPPTPYYAPLDSVVVHVVKDNKPSLERIFRNIANASDSQECLLQDSVEEDGKHSSSIERKTRSSSLERLGKLVRVPRHGDEAGRYTKLTDTDADTDTPVAEELATEAAQICPKSRGLRRRLVDLKKRVRLNCFSLCK